MIACAFVAALNDIRKDKDQPVLQPPDLLALLQRVVNVMHGRGSGFFIRFVKILDFITCMNFQLVDGFQPLLSCIRRVNGEAGGDVGNGVDGMNDHALGDPDGIRADEDEEAEEKGDEPRQEGDLRRIQAVHREIDPDVGQRNALVIEDRLVDRKQPAEAVIRDVRGDTPSRKELVKIFADRGIMLKDIAGLVRLQMGRVEIEDDVAAVLRDLVNVEVRDFGRGLAERVKKLLEVFVALDGPAAFEIIPDLLLVDFGSDDLRDAAPPLFVGGQR